tara:strand:+ start:194382 stop:194891 length:510 start_codon:yes stop_codon:yes gene_type:complete
MVSLLKNKYSIIILLFLSLNGCVTSLYSAGKPNALGTDIQVTPDRIITECEFITDYDGDRKSPYGFMIHILDLQNTVLTVSNGVVLEKEDCLERQTTADKIIKNAQIVTVRGRGDAETPIIKEEFKHTFKKHGTYFSNGRSLNFLAIWNDKGECHSGFKGEDDPCPHHP